MHSSGKSTKHVPPESVKKFLGGAKYLAETCTGLTYVTFGNGTMSVTLVNCKILLFADFKFSLNFLSSRMPWPGSSVGWSIILIHQSCGFKSQSGCIQEATKRMHK